MMEHKPECPSTSSDPLAADCQCHRLRACEQRVRQSAATLWDRTSEQMAAARSEGFAAGLDAAREAVAAALAKGLATSTDGALYFFELSGDPDFPNNGYDVTFRKDSLIAAIDALKEET